MKKLPEWIFCAFILALSHCVSIQAQAISGVVLDAAGLPVRGANIIGLAGNQTVCYTFSLPDGAFSLDSKGAELDGISVSHIGYVHQILPIEKFDSVIRLQTAEFELSAAGIVAPVIEEKGDTLTYDAAAFREKSDLVIGDILTRLPGIRVTDSGGIIHEGKPIGKFYVEGMDLMGSRYGVITNNLSADDISRIEVYRNHQPISALQGINPSESSAVNIILKETARNTWILNGDLAAGGPDFPLIDSRALLSCFSRERQTLLLARYNNAGTDIKQELREQPNSGRIGAFLVSNDTIEGDFQSMISPARTTLSLPSEFWYDNHSVTGQVNNLRKFSETASLRTFAQFAGEKYSESAMVQETVKFVNGDELTIIEQSDRGDSLRYFSAGMAMEKNTRKVYLSEQIGFSGQFAVSGSAAVSGDFSQNYKLPSFKVDNVLKSVLRASDRHAVELSSNAALTVRDHSASFITHASNARQMLGTRDLRFANRVSDEIRAGAISLKAYADLTLNVHDVRARMVQDDTRDAGREMTIYEIIPQAGLSGNFNMRRGRVTLALPLSFNMLSYDDNRLTYPTVSPSLSLVCAFSPKLEFQGGGRYSLSRSNYQDLLDVPVMRNYRTVVVGNGLKQTETASVFSSLNYRNNPAFLFASLSGNVTYTRTDKIASGVYSGSTVSISSLSAPLSYRSENISGSLSKYFGIKAFVVDLTGDVLHYESGRYLQGEYLAYSGYSVDSKLSLRTSALKWLSAGASADYGLERVFRDDICGIQKMVFQSDIAIYPVPATSIYSEYYHLYWISQGTSVSSKPLVKFGLSREISKISVFVEVRNALDADVLRKEIINPTGSSVTINYLRGREFMFGLRMR